MSAKILLVEDDTATSDYVAKGLVEEGFTVDRADNGRDGLFHATDGSYDCIVLDRMLPGIDGMAVLAALRGAGIDTPVIVLSALGSPEDRVKGLTGGGDDYLVKPFAFAELLARIRLLIRRGKAAPAVQTVLVRRSGDGPAGAPREARRARRGTPAARIPAARIPAAPCRSGGDPHDLSLIHI